MSNITIKVIHESGKKKLENEVNDYLKMTEKELVDIKFSSDGYGYHVMIIEK